MNNDGNNGKEETPDRPADDNNSQTDEDTKVDEKENSNTQSQEVQQNQFVKEADITDDPAIANGTEEDKSEQVKQSDDKTDKETELVKKDMILKNPFIYPKPSTSLPYDRPAFLFKPGVLEQAFSQQSASSSGQLEPPRPGNEDKDAVGSDDGHGEDTPVLQQDIQGSALLEDKQVEDGAANQTISLYNDFPLVGEIQDLFEEGIEVVQQTQAEEPLGNEDENYKEIPQTLSDQPNRVQAILGREDGDEEEPTVTEPQSRILLDKDSSASAELGHDTKVDNISVRHDYNSKSPYVQSSGGEGEAVQAEDKDKKRDISKYEEIVVVVITEELPPYGNKEVTVLSNGSESSGAAPVTTTKDISDEDDDIFELALGEHPSEASTSGFTVPVPIDVDNSDSDDDAFSLLELADTHLQCPICMEVFIVPTTINCGHTFCQECIQDWKKKHKVCPYCRARIKIMVTSNAMDQFITEMFGLLDEEGLERRREFVRQREENKKKKKK